VALAKSGYRVHAIDHVPAMLDLTRQSAMQAGVQDLIKTGMADICCLNQFVNNFFGVVLCLGVIGWLQSPEQAIREMHRVLKPDGCLILSVGNRWCLQDVLNPPYNPLLEPLRLKLVPWFRRVGLIAPATGGPRPLTRRRNAEIDAMLRSAGLQKIKSATIGFGPFTFFKMSLLPDWISMRLHETLQSWSDRNWPLLRSTGSMYVVLSRKPS
jgi:ubiquinone/menaquinone biosynthesis C-methylase UbiE